MTSPGPLTIALVMATPGTSWGGMEKHTADLASALAGRGHQVHLFAHRAYRHRFASSIHLHPLPVQLGRRNPWLKYQLRKALTSIRPDIVHAQGNKAASLVSALGPALRRKHIRTLGTVHGTKTSLKAFSDLDGVIGVSREITDSLTHPDKRLIYNGLAPADPEGQSPTFPVPTAETILLAAGRLEPVKQFDRLIRAWAASGCGGKLVILGEGSQRPALESLIDQLGAGDRILLPGYEPAILPWLQSATACIISSEREGFPYIMVEALLARCPVLSTPVSGVRDFLPETCIAASDSVEDIASLISQHLGNDADTERLKSLFRTGFQRADEQLTLEAMASNTERFYRTLLSRPWK